VTTEKISSKVLFTIHNLSFLNHFKSAVLILSSAPDRRHLPEFIS